MPNYEQLRGRLFRYYNNKILCRIGHTNKIEYNVENENHYVADMAVYLNNKYDIAVVWNLEHRRIKSHVVKTLSLSRSWHLVLPDKNLIRAEYKYMGNKAGAPVEKVLVMSCDSLNQIYKYLYEYLEINPYDKEYPNKSNIDDENVSLKIRERLSTSRWERDANFRNKVLESYGNQCAVCRCDEPNLLQAAHICSVALGGGDDVRNGICLCANHHLMFDCGLIEIDFDNSELSYIDMNVKKMAWYGEFINTYVGKIIKQKS
jgi:hypothetical protein